jgi:hypothetical protein
MEVNPASAFPGQRLPNLMPNLIRWYDEIFLLEPMLSAKAG